MFALRVCDLVRLDRVASVRFFGWFVGNLKPFIHAVHDDAGPLLAARQDFTPNSDAARLRLESPTYGPATVSS